MTIVADANMSETKGWIGVDLDGTLAVYDEWRGIEHIGEPIAPMVNRVRQWLSEGKEVRIMTARVSGLYKNPLDDKAIENANKARSYIAMWSMEHIGRILDITSVKDYGMIELWDDRCVQIEQNTGRMMVGEPPTTPEP